MKIAFDWQGTLDVHPELLKLAQHLQSTDIEVIILSVMPVTLRGIREKEIEAFKTGLPYKVLYHELADYHRAAGREKALWMKNNDYTVLVDDTQEVCEEAQRKGILTLKI